MDARGGRMGGLEPVSIHWDAEGMEVWFPTPAAAQFTHELSPSSGNVTAFPGAGKANRPFCGQEDVHKPSR